MMMDALHLSTIFSKLGVWPYSLAYSVRNGEEQYMRGNVCSSSDHNNLQYTRGPPTPPQAETHTYNPPSTRLALQFLCPLTHHPLLPLR